MPEQLQKKMLIDIQQKLYENDSSQGRLAVYQTASFGVILTLNDQIVLSEQHGFFYPEMMTHPALFTHHQPQSVAIIGNYFGMLDEVLKHPSVTRVTCIMDNANLEETVSQYFSQHQIKSDSRVEYCRQPAFTWLKENAGALFDVLIVADQCMENFLQEHYKIYHQALKPDGILVQACQSSLLQLQNLKPLFQQLQQGGFADCQALNFPQPSYPTGWRTAMLATSHPTFKRIREKDVYNRTFTTRYYNYDTHKAALALPEFMIENEH